MSEKTKARKGANMKRQIRGKLRKMFVKGESRHDAKQRARAEGKPRDFYTKDKIFSEKTCQNYTQFSFRLLKYAEERGEIREVDDLKEFVTPYLNDLIDKGLSAWTISAYLSAFNKLLGTEKSDFPELKDYSRRAEDIKQNRGDVPLKYNPDNYKAELTFCRCFGLRVHELRNLYLDQIKIEDGRITDVFVKQGKGGKPRHVSFYGSKEEHDFLLKDLQEKQARGWKKAFPAFTKELQIHRERREYANRVYFSHARDVSQIEDRTEKVIPRSGSNRGRIFDRKALEKVSQALGHDRVDVAYKNYL